MADRSGFDPAEVLVYRAKGIVPKNVRRVEVDRSVKFIPYGLFTNCRQLESVTLHEGLLRIGKYAFKYCTSLRIIQIPSTVTEIGWGAFRECSNLAAVDLPEGLEQINGLTFWECTSLEEVKIPASVTSIGDSAFHGCTNLLSLGLHEGLRIIGGHAFAFCCSMGSLRVPSSVDEIQDDAFCGCSSLSLVRLHEELRKMERFAFRGCTSLECFEFVRLSRRMEGIRMDNQTISIFESRLSEMTLVLTRGEDEDEDEDEDDSDDEEDSGAVWEKCKESLGRAHKHLNYLELKEAAPLLELALWKVKIEGQGGEGVQGEHVNKEDGGQDLRDARRERKRPKVTNNISQDTQPSREECRVKCGAGIVIPEVLKFFTYRSSWPRMDDSEEGHVN